MRLENDNREIGTDADNHQRHEHTIATRQFCDEENTRQRRMHYPRHHTRHTQQGKVLLRHIDAYLVDVPQTREQETCEAADEQRGSERTAAAATTICGRGSKHLGEQHQCDIRYQQYTIASPHRIVKYLIPINFRFSVQ